MPELDPRPGRVVSVAPLMIEAHVSRRPGPPKTHGVPKHLAPPDLRPGDEVVVHVDLTARIHAVTRPGQEPPSADAEPTGRPGPRSGPVAAPRAQAPAGGGSPRGTTQRSGARPERPTPAVERGEFLNPYAMIPAPPRLLAHPFLGDRRGPGHDVLLPDHWSGTIPITITAASPLLILDQGAVAKGDPIPVRLLNGEPVLEWTSVKGALRAVFEAVTNSRFAVFDDKFSQRLTLRQARGGRAPFPSSPRELLGADHEPATREVELSPADRLFGWARTDSRARDGARTVDAYRGHVRSSRITCAAGSGAVEALGEHGLWLSTLNSPKPEQYRFRVHDQHGQPVPSGIERSVSQGYVQGRRRLGRAAYWPHRGLPADYWDPSSAVPARGNRADEVGYEPTQVGGRYQEYLAPPGTKRDVARRIAGWVKPGIVFRTVDLRVENVEEGALGVLLWLLTVDDFLFTLGGGKPLGFGTVTIRTDLTKCVLTIGTERRAKYRSWRPQGQAALPEALQSLIDAARATLPEECVASVLAMGRGRPEFPVHYPRLRDPKTGATPPIATSYEWFVENERNGRRRSLPAPTERDPSLPYYDRRA